jgi:hypothetical protein
VSTPAAASVNTSSSNTNDVVVDVGIRTISPPGYPIQFFNDLVQQAPAQQAANITVQQYAVEVRRFIVDLSLQLHMLQTGSRAEGAREELKGLVSR